MRLLVLTLLVATAAEASSPYPLALPRGCRDRSCVRGRVVQSSAVGLQFEFAPASGIGMGTACACTTPTGANGETLTFARASSATCLKTIGTAPQTIANGDMVTCTSNQPRVMPGADGTSVLGLLVEDARQNTLLRSQEIENAAWTKVNAVVALPTVTANAAVSPDGTTTAERVQIPATTVAGSSYSFIYQLPGSMTPTSCSVYVKGNGTSGTLDLCAYVGHFACANCGYVSSGWSRCVNENVSAALGCGFGNFSGLGSVTGSGDRTAQDVFITDAQDELGPFASSYIATTSAAVTRASESTPYVTLSKSISGAASIAASFIAPVTGHDGGNYNSTDMGGDGVVALAASTADPVGATLAVEYDLSSSMNCYQQDAGVLNPGTLGFGATQQFVDRVSCSTMGAGVNRFFSGGLDSGYTQAVPGFGAAASNIVLIGGWSTAAPPLNGVIKKVCVGSSSLCTAPVTWTTRLAWDGDSIVYGYPRPASSPPVQLTALIGSQAKQVVDFGHNGDAISDCAAKWAANIKGQGYTTLIWSCAVNDLVIDHTGAAMAAAAETTLAAALADGERVIVTSVMPWKNSASWTIARNAQGLAYNTAISAWAGSHGVTYVDSYTAMGGEGGDPDVLLAAYAYNDHIHPSVAGQAKLAQLVQAASP